MASIKFPRQMPWILWGIFLVVTCLSTILGNYNHTVSLNYWLASRNWLMAHPLYSLTGAGFIYLPHSAILYIPFALLPFHLSEILWRISSLTMYVWGIYCFAAMMQHSRFNQIKTGNSYTYIKSANFFFLLITIIAIPLTFSSARNGQMHLFIFGLMLWAMHALSLRQWLKCATLLLIALALKPTTIVLAMMLGALYWSVGWRLLLGLLVFLLFPFLTQAPDYVWHQYVYAVISLQKTMEVGTHGDWAQVFSMLSQFGMTMSDKMRAVAQVIFAAAVFGLGYILKKRYSITEAGLWIFTLSICYLLLFNARTEDNGYFMLAPAMGLLVSQGVVRKQFFLWGATLLIWLVYIFSYYVTHALTPGHKAWLSPLLGLLFSGLLLSEILKMLLPKNTSIAVKTDQTHCAES